MSVSNTPANKLSVGQFGIWFSGGHTFSPLKGCILSLLSRENQHHFFQPVTTRSHLLAILDADVCSLPSGFCNDGCGVTKALSYAGPTCETSCPKLHMYLVGLSNFLAHNEKNRWSRWKGESSIRSGCKKLATGWLDFSSKMNLVRPETPKIVWLHFIWLCVKIKHSPLFHPLQDPFRYNFMIQLGSKSRWNSKKA